MKTRIATAVASLIIASMGTVAYAQSAQQTTPENPPPTSSPYTNSTQPDQSAMGQDSSSMNKTSSMDHDSSMQHSSSSDKTERKIKHELTSHGITATDVNVSFSNGTATLSGTVATQNDINKAKHEAMRVRGVKHVDTSNLQVKAQTPQSSSD